MTSLVMMYVYFDDYGDIKAITPNPDAAHRDIFGTATFPLADVELFLTGQKNPFDYMVSEAERSTGRVFKLVKKQNHVILSRTLDNYLTEVSEDARMLPIIKIVNDLKTKSITLRIDSDYKDLLKTGTDDEQDDVLGFINSGVSCIYITGKHNPYHHLFTIEFATKDLFSAGRLIYPYGHLDLSKSSAYTKKIVKSYGYVFKEK